ncbi:hypothetical protein AB0R12_11090, partial [Streptomyces niveus]
MGEDVRLRAVVQLAQAMASAHTPNESWRAAALGARDALAGSFAALSVWERDLGQLKVLGTLISLLLIGLLGSLFIGWASLTGNTDDN